MVYIYKICLLFSEKMTCFRGDFTRISELTMMVEHLEFFSHKTRRKYSQCAQIYSLITSFLCTKITAVAVGAVTVLNQPKSSPSWDQ